MKVFTVLVLIAFSAAAYGQPRQAPIPPQAPKVVEVAEPIQTPKKAAFPTYAEAMNLAAANGKHVVAFVGVPVVRSRSFTSAEVCHAENGLEGYPARCVVISEPNGKGWMSHKATLPANATDEQIQSVIDGRTVSQAASPFGLRLRPGEVRADADLKWPVGLSFLSDMEPYQTAKQSQISFRRWSGFIGPQDRMLSHENKWNVPGGMDGIHGWTSQLYRSKAHAPRVFLGRAEPDEVNGTVTWQRSYPDGAAFADVLVNAEGNVFEVRVAEKRNGVWERFVAFADRGAQPHGYTRISSNQCASCHDRAGEAAYGSAVIPGGDTIFSDPIPIIERGETVQNGFGLQL